MHFVPATAAAAALMSVLAGVADVRADGPIDPPARRLLEKVRDAQRGLQTARARCIVHTMLSLLDATMIEEGTVAWKRMPDGSVRQRWDLEAKDTEGNPIRSAIFVTGPEILYLKEGRIVEKGPLLASDIFHHPALGGLVFIPPSEDALKDPDFSATTFSVPEAEKGDETVPHPRPEPGEAPAGPGEDSPGYRNPDADDLPGEGSARAPGFFLHLKPRKLPWKGLLEEVALVFDAKHGMIVSAEYRENNNNQYSLVFRDFEANPRLDDGFFTPPAPEDPAPEKQ